MTIKSTRPSVGTMASQISPLLGVTNDPALSLLVYNVGSIVVYLGGPDVTSANGVPLDPGANVTIDIDMNDSDVLFAVAASATTVSVLVSGAHS